jgi:nucleoside phosphorylase
MAMKTLVTYAVEAEFAPWRALREFEKTAVGGVELQRTKVGRSTVDFVITGVGTANAQRAMEGLARTEYSMCIASGFAGALQASVKVGDVVVAKRVQQDGSGRIVACAQNFWNSAMDDGAKPIETLLTTAHLVNAAAEKSRLASFGEAVDMESFAILSTAQASNIPAIAMRVISDSFDGDLPAGIDTLVDEQGNVHGGRVVRYVARHPLAIPALMRLGRESKAAAEALARFLEAYIKKLSLATHGWPPPELQEVAAS